MDFASEGLSKSNLGDLEFVLVRKDSLDLESKSEPVHVATNAIDAKVARVSVIVCEVTRCILVACKHVQQYQLVAFDIPTRMSYYMVHPA